MKRLVGSLVLSGLAVWGYSQAPFTIVHPTEGQTVKEQVKIDVPAKSLPPGGYIGVYLNDKLIEATVPPKVGKYYEYVLDTKGRGIPDTGLDSVGKPAFDNLKLVLYTDYDEHARMVDSSSVNIRIGNKAGVPTAGIKLRYKFNPGSEMIYDLTQHVEQQDLTQSQLDNPDAKAAITETEGESIRIAYSVVNRYDNGDGLLCMQVLPTKGKDYALLTPAHGTTQQRWTEDQMVPVYMRITPTGHERFGTMTHFFGIDGLAAGSGPTEELLPLFPLPTLPEKAIHNGDEWPSRFQDGADLDLSDWVNINSIVEAFPAKGQFVGVEWERGYKCAKIQNVIEAATESLKIGGSKTGSGDKVSVTETIWFALSTHEILKIERDSTIDRKVEASNAPGGGFGGAGGPPGFPGMGGPGGAAGPMGRPGMGAGGTGDQMTEPTQTIKQFGQGKGNFMGGQGRGRGGFGFPGGGQNRGFGGQNGMGQQAPAQPTYVRLHILQTFTLEK